MDEDKRDRVERTRLPEARRGPVFQFRSGSTRLWILRSPRPPAFLPSSAISASFPLSSRRLETRWAVSTYQARTMVSGLGRCLRNVAATDVCG